MDWQKEKLNLEYLEKSGLLFEINRTILHLFGISLETENGKFIIKDNRNKPESLFYQEDEYNELKAKLKSFMETFGWSQLEKREKALGWGCQWSAKVIKPNAK